MRRSTAAIVVLCVALVSCLSLPCAAQRGPAHPEMEPLERPAPSAQPILEPLERPRRDDGRGAPASKSSSPMPPPAVLVPLFVALVFGLWLVARSLDTGRISRYIAAQGGTMLEKRWRPFGRGWFGEKSDRIYEVRYLDREGNQHRALCKTSLLTGVYWTEDEIIEHASGAPASLEEENRRLREELEKLRKERW